MEVLKGQGASLKDKGGDKVLDSVNNADSLNTKLSMGIGERKTSGKKYMYCELSCWDKKNDKYYKKIHPASKFSKVHDVHEAMSRGLIPYHKLESAVTNLTY